MCLVPQISSLYDIMMATQSIPKGAQRYIVSENELICLEDFIFNFLAFHITLWYSEYPEVLQNQGRELRLCAPAIIPATYLIFFYYPGFRRM